MPEIFEDFHAEWDARTLAEAAAITGDPVRFQAARQKASLLIDEKQREIVALRRLQEPQPVPEGGTLGSPFNNLLTAFPPT